jgi:hypothetical protein
VIPSDIFENAECRLAMMVDFDAHGSGHMRVISLHVAIVETQCCQSNDCLVSQSIRAYATRDDASISEQRTDVGEICWRPTKLLAGRKQVPEQFSKTDNRSRFRYGIGHARTDA